MVVHGTARGADEIAGRIAKTLGLKVEEHPAEWTRYGRRAGFIRNRAMATAGADLCIAFWTNGSTGTGHMLRIAREAGIPTEIHSL